MKARKFDWREIYSDLLYCLICFMSILQSFYYFYITLISSLFFVSCSASNEVEDKLSEAKEIKLVSAKADKTMPLSELFEIEAYIPLETRDDVFIGEISQLIVANNTIWILDNMVEQVLGFSEEGKLITVINQKGEGPGQYLRISDVSVTDNAIYVYDAWSGKMLGFDWNGGLISEKRGNLSASHFETLDEGSFVFYHDYSANGWKEESEPHYNLTFIDENLKIKSQFLPNELLPAPEYLTGNHKAFSRNGHELLLMESYQNVVYRIIDNGVVPYLKFNWSDHHDAMVRDFFEDTRSGDWSLERSFDHERREEIGRFVELQENDKVLICSYVKREFVYHVFYDKENNKTLELQKKMAEGSHPVALINDLDNTIYYPLLAAQGDSFYSFTDAYQLRSGEVISERLEDLLSRLPEDPNPIIVKLKIKPF